MTAIFDIPDFNFTMLFWLAVPVVLFIGYWLAPWLTRQPKKGGRL